MTLDLVLSPDRRYLTIQASGETAFEDLDQVLHQAVQTCRQHGIKRVLVDARLARNNLTRLDLFNLASNLPASGFLPGTRFAVLVDLETPDIAYFERVAGSRGALVDHFLGQEEALEVLLAPEFG